MTSPVLIELPEGFSGTIVIRIGQPVQDGAEPQFGPAIEAMYRRFNRYTAASPCWELGAALKAAGWRPIPPTTHDPDRRAQPYVRWELSRQTGKPLVIYQHSKKLATLRGTAEEEAFFANYAEDGVNATMQRLGTWVQKMSAAPASGS